MSDLREKIEGILQAGDMFLEPPEDMAQFIDKGAIKQSRADQILAAFKAHIEGCDKPENPHKCYCDKYSPHTMTKGQIARDAKYHGYEYAIEADRKALMESLEEEVKPSE